MLCVQKSVLTQPAPFLSPSLLARLSLTSPNAAAGSKVKSAVGQLDTAPSAADVDTKPPVSESELREAERVWTAGLESKPQPRKRQHPMYARRRSHFSSVRPRTCITLVTWHSVLLLQFARGRGQELSDHIRTSLRQQRTTPGQHHRLRTKCRRLLSVLHNDCCKLTI